MSPSMFFGLLTSVVSFLAALGVRMLAWRYKIVDCVGSGRKIHARATPLLGGVAIVVALLIGILLARQWGALPASGPLAARLTGFCLALLVLLVGGVLDDRYDLPPWWQVIFPIGASLIVISTGTSIVEVSSLQGAGTWRLDMWQWTQTFFGHTWSIRFPADLLTLVWLLGVTYATKAMDGLDGLVTGHTIVGAGLILLLASSPAFYQPHIMVLIWIVLGAFLGFLPWNIHPARHFLGEVGSTVAGFSLGFLAIVSGAKVATAFMALGIPLVDFILVIFLRLRGGRSPFRGDDSHLHFRLLRLGFSQRQVAALFWMLALTFGFVALALQTRGKIMLMLGLICVTILLSFSAAFRQQALSSTCRVRLFVSAVLITVMTVSWSVVGLWRERRQTVSTTVLREVIIRDRRLWLEIADTPDEWRQGLSGRASLAVDHGMLFVFPAAEPRRFWMPGMRFDLDVIWLRGDRVVDVTRLQAPRAGEDPMGYTPTEPADRVLELRAGGASVYGIRTGDALPELSAP